MALYVGIDLGTSGCRAAAIDQSGTLRGFVQVGLPPTVQKGGQLVQNPLDWWSATLDALGRLVKKISAGEIRAIAVDGTSSTVFLIAADGTPRSPALMYNDNSCVRESTIIQKIAPADCAVHGATSTLAKLLYLQHQDYARNVHYVAHQADWIAGKLTNRFGGSDYHNALKLGYDTVHSGWPDWLDRLLLEPGCSYRYD